jgi:predicted dehydrogenase
MACQKARQVVQNASFGPVMMIHGNYLQEFNAFPAPLDWRYNTALAGRMRAVTEIGSHWADISQYISGRRILAVSALFGRFNPTRTLENGMMYPVGKHEGEEISVVSEDAACVSFKFEGGAIGAVTLSEVSQGRINRITLEITGENKNLWWNSEDNNMLNTAVKGGGVNTEVFGFGNGFADTFRSLVEHFYEAVKAGGAPEEHVYPGFAEGANIVKICNAMLKSADSDGAWVAIS